MRRLLELGAEVMAADHKGIVPLHRAAVSGCEETLTRLLQVGYMARRHEAA